MLSDEFLNRMRSDFMADAKAPLVTLDDCYDALDVSILPNLPKPEFAAIQQAYRHRLWKFNPAKEGLSAEAVEYKTLMTNKVREAYKRICEALGEDPEAGLLETEESLLAERDRLLEGWKDWWCGTPSLYIEAEYKERIEALKKKKKKKD